MADGTCRLCGDTVIWAPAVATGALLALNPKTNLCRTLHRADLHMARTWAQHGVTFHAEHNCNTKAAA